MESLGWFGFSNNNSICGSSIDVQALLPFLQNRPHKLIELAVLVDDKEESALWEGEEPLLQTQPWQTVKRILELSETKFLSTMQLTFESGEINFQMGEFYVKFPEGEDLRTPTSKLLEQYGYYAGDMIIDTCFKYPGMHLLHFARGKHPQDIATELERMISWSKKLERESESLL